eukprot:COSAG06_NODE_3096_length_5863_cov_412.347328_5_plen_187_part_00
MDELTVGRVLFAGSDANVHLKKKSEGEGEGGQSPLKGGSKHKVDKHTSEDVATADADAGSPAVRHSRKGLGAFSLSPLSRLPPLSSCLLTRACRAKRSCFFHLHNHNKTHTRSETHHRCCLVWSGLVWSGLVWSGLVWSGLVLSCLVCAGPGARFADSDDEARLPHRQKVLRSLRHPDQGTKNATF